MFKKIIVEEDGELSGILAEPFDLLLSPEVRQLSATPLEVAALGRARTGAGAHKGARRVAGAFRVGLNNETLVGAGGFEPP